MQQNIYFFLGAAFLGLAALGFAALGLTVLAFLGLLAAFLGAAGFFAFLGLFVAFLVAAAAGFLAFLGDFLAAGFFAAALLGFLAAAGFLAAGFFALGAAFLAGFFLVSVCFLLSLKEPEAPVPLTWTRVPLVTRLLMASLTREFFFSTSYPPAARAFFSAARDTPLLSLDADTALTIRSPTLGPAFLALAADFFLGALAFGAVGAGAGAVSAIFPSGFSLSKH